MWQVESPTAACETEPDKSLGAKEMETDTFLKQAVLANVTELMRLNSETKRQNVSIKQTSIMLACNARRAADADKQKQQKNTTRQSHH